MPVALPKNPSRQTGRLVHDPTKKKSQQNNPQKHKENSIIYIILPIELIEILPPSLSLLMSFVSNQGRVISGLCRPFL